MPPRAGEFGWQSRKYERRIRPPTAPPVTSNQKFDRPSGLQYSETSSGATGEDDRNWIHVVHSSKLGVDAYKRIDSCPLGTRSLQDTVYEFIAQNISRFSLEGLQFLPVRLVQKLWDILRKRNGISFHVFTLFAAILSKEATRPDLLKHQTQIVTQRSPLDAYTKPLTSKAFEFLSFLSITSPLNGLADLVKLSSIKNIIALEIVAAAQQSDTGVSDRLVRAWSFAVRDDGAFPVLRILRLWNHEDVTSLSLSYVDIFPVLTVFDIRGCNGSPWGNTFNLHKATWKACMDLTVLCHLETACLQKRQREQEKLGLQKPIIPTARKTPPVDSKASVRWIPRNSISEYLNKPKATAIAPPLSPRSRRRQKKQPLAGTGAWEFSMYASINRIGELRNDQDIDSHVSIENQASVGNDLIVSHPIACFRLGPTLPCLEPVKSDANREYHLAFVRLCLPETSSFRSSGSVMHGKANSGFVDGSGSNVPLAQNTANISAPFASHPEPKSSIKTLKRATSVLPKNKRRKLDDVLASFF